MVVPDDADKEQADEGKGEADLFTDAQFAEPLVHVCLLCCVRTRRGPRAAGERVVRDDAFGARDGQIVGSACVESMTVSSASRPSAASHGGAPAAGAGQNEWCYIRRL
jgi:hypothetical protein